MEAKRIVPNVVLILVCLVFVVPSVMYLYPPLVGADGSYIVLSGSMSPALRPGDLVIVKKVDPATIDVGDLVSIKLETTVFTHRVFKKELEDGVYQFKTKGDTNEDPDPGWTEASKIIGKTVFTIPLGYLYSPYGYILSFLIPCVLLVGKQIYHVFSLFKRRSKRELRRWRRQKHPVLDTTSVLLLMILVISGSWLMAPYFQLGSFSYFSDSEWTGVTFKTGTWALATPRYLKQQALDELHACMHVDHKLEMAMDHIEKSLDPDLWVDDDHLDSKQYHEVFDKEKKAVKKLMELTDQKDTPQLVKDVCQLVIDKLVEADDMLAHTVYDEAQEYAGDPQVDKELEKCDEEFEKAQKELEHKKKDGTPDPKYDKAIDHYKKAWEHAQKALKHAA